MTPLSSFHVYPSKAQTIVAYSRSIPLQADVVEWDTTGAYDPVNFCWIAPIKCVVDFHANVLFQAPLDGANLSLWFMKNILPPLTPIGEIGGELAGVDISLRQPANGSIYNASAILSRKFSLQPGDKIWAVPGLDCGGQLTAALDANGNSTNFFEGVVLCC